MVATTIQIKKEVKSRLENYKLHRNETYNEVIERLIEDVSLISEETKKELQAARKEVAEGNYKTHEEVKKELSL